MSSVPFTAAAANPTIAAAAFEVVARAAAKEETRDRLPDGASYSFDVAILGHVDGQPVNESLAGRLTVGHASERKSHSLSHEAIVAALLARMSKTARAKAVRELPGLYAAHGGDMPELLTGDRMEAKSLLAACKEQAATPSTVRGAVRCEYVLGTPAIVGFVGNGNPAA